jgi:hypothetical protein
MIRDERSRALINDDLAALNKYKVDRDRVRKIEQIYKELPEIRRVLSSLCERLDKIEST